MITEVAIPIGGGETIAGDVAGERQRGAVIFAHGSGSSRHSPRNRLIASALHVEGFQTILLDLLTEAEERADVQTRVHRFDIDLLTERVMTAISWLRAERFDGRLGLFGASTGAAAALQAAVAVPSEISAVVSRGGRPDLAGDSLAGVRAPTLLIVGGKDDQVVELNKKALAALNNDSSLEVVEDAGHLFEEPGKLERVADLAVPWFRHWLGRDFSN